MIQNKTACILRVLLIAPSSLNCKESGFSSKNPFSRTVLSIFTHLLIELVVMKFLLNTNLTSKWSTFHRPYSAGVHTFFEPMNSLEKMNGPYFKIYLDQFVRNSEIIQTLMIRLMLIDWQKMLLEHSEVLWNIIILCRNGLCMSNPPKYLGDSFVLMEKNDGRWFISF